MYIGIDLGGTNIAAGLVDDKGNIIYKDSIPTRRERPVEEVIADMAAIAKRVTEMGGYTLADVKAVGIGCPGTVDNTTGMVVYSNNIVMDHVPLVEEFRRHIDLPVNLENDANAAAYGEYIICAKDKKSFVFMTLGTGVGGGIILDGKIWRGFNGAGAEIGHSTLIMGGRQCTCGKKGCLEAYASVTALIAQTNEAIEAHPESMMAEWAKKHGKVNGRTSFECAEAGDKVAIEVRDRYIEYVADGVASIMNILQPEMFVIGGGISREGDKILVPLKKYAYENDYNKHMAKTEIQIATLFGDAGIVGAAMACKEAEM